MSVCRIALRFLTLALVLRAHLMQNTSETDVSVFLSEGVGGGGSTSSDGTTGGPTSSDGAVMERIEYFNDGSVMYIDRGYCTDPMGNQYPLHDPHIGYHEFTYRWQDGMRHYKGFHHVEIARWYKKHHYPEDYVFCSVSPENYTLVFPLSAYFADFMIYAADKGINWKLEKYRNEDFVIYSMMCFFGVSANVIMLATILKYKQLQTPTNYFLCSMAVGDILYMLSDSVAQMCYRYYMNFMDVTDAGCKIIDHLRTSFFALTVIHNLAIAFERYFAICWPMKVAMHCSNKRSLKIIAGLWLLSFILTAPKTQGMHVLGHLKMTQVYCYFIPFAQSPEARAMVIYMVVPLFLVPAAIMLFLYVSITRTLLGSIRAARKMKGDNEKSSEQLRSRVQVVKLLWTVYACFLLTWIPNRAMEIINYWYHPGNILHSHVDPLVTVARVQKVAFANSALNPFLFFLMSQLFRNCVLNMLSCGRRKSKDTNPSTHISQTGVTALTTSNSRSN